MLSGFIRHSGSGIFIKFRKASLHLRLEGRRKFWPWTKRENEKDKLKIIKPSNCDSSPPILEPQCKVAIVVGGASNIGLSAADSLLYHGARAVILADEDPWLGEAAAKSLCHFYGKNRALFIRCDMKNSCQLNGIFEKAMCRYKAVDILFSNFDTNKENKSSNNIKNNDAKDQMSNTMTAIRTGMQYMGQNRGGAGGIIINSSSIIGFMGWPDNPTPVYCFKEPVVETTMDLGKTYPLETTGVRVVALLKSHKPFAEIGLPDIPKSDSRTTLINSHCEASPHSRIGKAVIHVMAHAENCTTWLSEPAPCLREIPWLINFPDNSDNEPASR